MLQTVTTGGQLAPSVREALPEDNSLRVGKVLTVSGATVTVDVAGGPPTVGVLGWYTPVVGDTVALMRAGATWLLFGSIVGGSTGIAPTGQSRILNGSVVSTATVGTTVTPTLIPGMSLTLNIPVSGCSWTASAVFDFTKSGATAGTAIGLVLLDTVNQPVAALYNAATAGQRNGCPQNFSGTGLTAGNHTWEAYFYSTVAATYNINIANSTLYVEIWR